MAPTFFCGCPWFFPSRPLASRLFLHFGPSFARFVILRHLHLAHQLAGSTRSASIPPPARLPPPEPTPRRHQQSTFVSLRSQAGRHLYATATGGQSDLSWRSIGRQDLRHPTGFSRGPAPPRRWGGLSAFAIDRASGQTDRFSISSRPAAGPPPPSSVDATGRMLIVANYGSAYIAALPIAADGRLGASAFIDEHGPRPAEANRDRQAAGPRPFRSRSRPTTASSVRLRPGLGPGLRLPPRSGRRHPCSRAIRRSPPRPGRDPATANFRRTDAFSMSPTKWAASVTRYRLRSGDRCAHPRSGRRCRRCPPAW